LHIQIQHKLFTKIEYHINYYAIHTYWPYSEHEIIQWEGDERELYTRQINGIDLNINVLTLFCTETNFGFSVGPTFRRRYETGFELCQYTSGGWMEWFIYNETHFDMGINLEIHYNYFIWEKLGLGIGIIERIYDSDPSSFSINGGIVYKFDFNTK